MNSRKTNILGIVPYEAMKPALESLAENRDDLSLDVYVGDLSKGVEIVKSLHMEDYDIIISRGGTSRLIEQNTTIPVVEINISVYDILHTIRLADNYRGKYAIVGFPSITTSARLLCDLLQYDIPIHTIHSSREAENLLAELKKEGFRLVLCDVVTSSIARSLEINAILITSGMESLQEALNRAVKTHGTFRHMEERQLFLDSLLQHSSMQTAVFTPAGELCYSSSGLQLNTELLSLLSQEIPAAAAGTDYKCFKLCGGILYAVESRKFQTGEKQYVAFYLADSHSSLLKTRHGVSYLNLKDAEKSMFNSFYGVVSLSEGLCGCISSYAQNRYPIMILGESGTRKKYAAEVLYSQSTMKTHPFIVIDCVRLSGKEWNFLISHYNSPLNDRGNTLFFDHLDSLPEEKLQKLLSTIIEQELHKTNKILFSCTTTEKSGIAPLILEFIHDLSCLILNMPPLRDNMEDIPSFSSLYLNSLNIELSKQIAGFRPDAMELLQQYPWPHNYTQFKRVLKELAVLATTPYIQAHEVNRLLEAERCFNVPGQNTDSGSGSLPEGSLEDIIRGAIHRTVRETGGNQSAAAKKLQISRTTLWKYLKE
ncbi:MAG: sigma 54-interacting transcriptional regulator [Lachnospiraceae bacterium]|jgi:transcriptional regulator with AAA-type ATPase domain|nr:sigma 54-interacting transcriptional regulator [Lachnospiraceae bacterium]